MTRSTARTQNEPALVVPWLMRLVLAVALVWGTLAAPVVAQGNGSTAAIQPTPDAAEPTAWDVLAQQAETTLARGEASDGALEELRRRLSDAREAFSAGQGDNSARIATIQAQISALGTATAGEDVSLTARRDTLVAQLAALRAPILQAEERFRQADGLIAEIDATLRARQTAALTRAGPSPLRPDLWAPAFQELDRSVQSLRREVLGEWTNDATRAQLRADLPLVLGWLALSLALIFWGVSWARRGIAFLRRQFGAGTGVWTFAWSLVRIGLPLGGLLALVQAVEVSGLFGLRGALILQALPLWGTTVLIGFWLATQVFDADGLRGTQPLTGFARAQGIWVSTALAVMIAGLDIVAQLVTYDRYSEETRAVLMFPLILGAGVCLVILGGFLVSMRAPNDPLRGGVIRLAGRGAILVGLIGPILAALGYGVAAQALLVPAAYSLALGGAVMVVQELIHGLYRLITGRQSADSLIPVMAGFAVFLAALPVLALIWGARVTDLVEIWSRFTQGVALGDARLSPGSLVIFAGVFAAGYVITRALQAALRLSVFPRTTLDIGAQTALTAGAGYLGIALAAIVAFAAAGLDLSGIAIVAGALSVGIGFGLQNIVSNFVSGIILLVERPIAPGDWIEVGGVHGTVRDISVRSTTVETFDRYDVILPNADLVSGKVVNYTRGNVLGRILVPVTVAYDSDPREVERILLSIAREHDMVLMNPEPAVDFLGFGDSALEFRIRAVLRDVNYVLSVRNDMNHAILQRFRDAGIEIPFPQRDVHLRSGGAVVPVQPAHNEVTE